LLSYFDNKSQPKNAKVLRICRRLISGCAEGCAGYVFLVSSLLDTLMASLNHFSRQIEDNESSYACLANFMNLVHKNKVVT
jgi:hypothetical protein